MGGEADDQLQAVFAAGRNAAAMDIDDVFDNIEAKTAAALAGMQVVKELYIPGKLVNVVVKPQ